MLDATTKTVTCEKHGITYDATFITLGGKPRMQPCPKCAEDFRNEELTQREKLEAENKRKHVEQLFQRSGIPPRYTTRNFENFRDETPEQAKALRMAKDYAENISEKQKTGAGLILSGKPGTGKTHLACSVGNKFIQAGGGVLFITVSAMIRRIRETYRQDSSKTEQQAINDFRDIGLLIIDEIGVQKGSESEEHLLFEIISERYNYFKPTILISNHNAEEVKAYIGERALDRMREGGGKFIAFEWESYRPKVQADTNLPDADKAIYRESTA